MPIPNYICFENCHRFEQDDDISSLGGTAHDGNNGRWGEDDRKRPTIARQNATKDLKTMLLAVSKHGESHQSNERRKKFDHEKLKNLLVHNKRRSKVTETLSQVLACIEAVDSKNVTESPSTQSSLLTSSTRKRPQRASYGSWSIKFDGKEHLHSLSTRIPSTPKRQISNDSLMNIYFENDDHSSKISGDRLLSSYGSHTTIGTFASKTRIGRHVIRQPPKRRAS